MMKSECIMTKLSGKPEPFRELGEVGAVRRQTGFHEALQMAAMLSGVLVKIFVSLRKVMRDWRNADGLCLGVKPRFEIRLNLNEALAALRMPVEAESQVRPGISDLELAQEDWAGLSGVLIDERDVSGSSADFQCMGHTRFGKLMEPLAFSKPQCADRCLIVEAFEEDHGRSGRKRSRLKKALMSISMSSIRWSSFIG